MDVRGWLSKHLDLVLGAAVAVLYAVDLARWDGGDPLRLAPFALLGAASLTLRRRTPLPAFALAASSIWGMTLQAPAFANESAALLVVLFTSLYSLGRYAEGTTMWLGAGAVLVFAVVFVIGDSAGRPVDPADVGFATLFIGTPWAAGVAIRLRRDREHSLTQRNLELQRDQEARAREAVAAERARIARELHDVVSHAISVTVLQARGGRKVLGTDDEAVGRCLDAIEHTNTQALSDMRRLLCLLRDTEDGPHVDPQPSLVRLDDLVDQVRTSGLMVELAVSGSRERVPPGVDLSAYRIVQEALTNVLKHAGPGARALVQVTYGPDELDLRVADEGGARRNGDGSGRGLIGIRERVAVVGGQVEAGPAASGGFVVHARLPYAVEA